MVFGLAAGLGYFFGDLFAKVPTNLARQALWVLLLLGANVWLGFLGATFAQLLHARDRFDLRNVADVVVLLGRAAGTVAVLWAGHGLVALGTLVPMMVSGFVFIPLYACAKVEMRVTQYLRLTMVRWVIGGALFGCFSLASAALIPPAGWGAFWLKVGLLGLICVPIGAFVVLGFDQARDLLRTLSRAARASR